MSEQTLHQNDSVGQGLPGRLNGVSSWTDDKQFKDVIRGLDENMGRDVGERVPEARYGVYVGEFLWVGNEPLLAVSDLEPEERNEYDRLFTDFEPVRIPEYSSVEEFAKDERPVDPETGKLQVGTVNFLGFFQDPESVTGEAHRYKLAWKRLYFLEHYFQKRGLEGFDFIARLEPRLQGVTSIQKVDHETRVLLMDAYNLMANLVSVNDPDVVLTHEGNTADGEKYSARDYLKR